MQPNNTFERSVIRGRALKVLSSCVTIFAAAILAGCFPYAMNYVSLDGAEVTYRRSPCRDGAPVGVAYERGGVRFEVSLEPHALSPLKDAYVKLRAPRDAAISIPESTALMTFAGRREATAVHLVAAPLDWQGPYVEEARRKSPLAEYRFIFADLPPIDSPGTLQLPAVLVNGVRVESPVLTFERRSYVGMPPLNC